MTKKPEQLSSRQTKRAQSARKPWSRPTLTIGRVAEAEIGVLARSDGAFTTS
ncbi:hypothetical protein [Sphingomonas sp.]|uniref:hypothetical protein n=1 Tax=Sphingomonas sp. TaxID=28214 RepID=UPI001DE9FDAD|nr:hypothetical protein [Sphingomonas sp.]MBX9797084.1 hypothetical protein [Sphingomonas sp.]